LFIDDPEPVYWTIEIFFEKDDGFSSAKLGQDGDYVACVVGDARERYTCALAAGRAESCTASSSSSSCSGLPTFSSQNMTDFNAPNPEVTATRWGASSACAAVDARSPS
jgi:hypothetical protein